MKKCLVIFLAALLVLPTFMPWMPHGFVHALHDLQKIQEHSLNHSVHDHDGHTQTNIHHPVYIDVKTYFSNYLNVELQRSDQIALTVPIKDIQNSDFALDVAAVTLQRHEVTLRQSRGPPNRQNLHHHYPPIYLSTLRLRI